MFKITCYLSRNVSNHIFCSYEWRKKATCTHVLQNTTKDFASWEKVCPPTLQTNIWDKRRTLQKRCIMKQIEVFQNKDAKRQQKVKFTHLPMKFTKMLRWKKHFLRYLRISSSLGKTLKSASLRRTYEAKRKA